MKRFHSNISSGFTLVEVIATIIAIGILAAFFIHFMGTAMNQSWKSVELVAGEGEAEGKMEEIIAYYTSKINDNPENALSIVVSQFDGVATMKYIKFSTTNGDEMVDTSPDPWNLKVTIEAPGNILSTVLTKSRSNSSDSKVNY
jgi:prepilin-type N-terminal cleavage/methylation domain-containing protein